MTIPTATTVPTLLDTQNQVKSIAATPRDVSKVSIKLEGDFDSGAVEVGYINNSGSFEVATGGTFTAEGDFIYTIGRNKIVYARATGASPAVNVETDLVE